MTAPSYDYVIVGAGTAGCVLAQRLTEDPDVRVLLLEAGGRDDYRWIHIPVGYLYCIDNPRTDWRYRTRAEPGLNGRALLYPRGRVLGGCSSINGMIWMRGQREDYDAWAEAAGDDGWRWDAVLPLFKRSEDHYRGASEFHGAGGPWRVEAQRLRWEILEAVVRACEQAGIPATADFNTGDNFGVGYFEVNQRRGVRWNAAKACLRPIAGRAQLHAADGRARAQARRRERPLHRRRVRRRRRRARRARDRRSAARGRRDQLAAAPRAVGDRPSGRAAGVRHRGRCIRCRAWARTCRITCSCGWWRRCATCARSTRCRAASLGKLRIGAEYALRRGGPMSMAPSQLGAFARSDPGQARANVEYHVQPLSLPKFGDPLHEFDAITASVCNLRPTSRGSVHIASNDPAAAPVIAPNYLATDEDRRVAVDSLRLTRRILAAPALAPYAPDEMLPGPAVQSRRRAGARGRRHRHDDLPSGGHVPDGRRVRSARRRRRRVARARHRGTARRRRVGDAHDHVGQHQRADGHDRRARERADPRRSRVASPA